MSLASLEVEKLEHEAIVAALAARDLPGLQEALRNHILRGRQSLVAGLEQ